MGVQIDRVVLELDADIASATLVGGNPLGSEYDASESLPAKSISSSWIILSVISKIVFQLRNIDRQIRPGALK